MLRSTSFSLIVVGMLCSCGSGAANNSDAAPDGADDTGEPLVVSVTEDSFGCILEWEAVRRFYITNLLGDVAASVAVATGDAAQPYPPGTLIQLVPQEAMVKREPGFSPETNDWEFFALSVNGTETTINSRGPDAVNFANLNCINCHSAAADNDFICESGHGCVELGLEESVIRALQDGDSRCTDL